MAGFVSVSLLLFLKFPFAPLARFRAAELFLGCVRFLFTNERPALAVTVEEIRWRHNFYSPLAGKATPISYRKKVRKAIGIVPIRTRRRVQETHAFPGNPPVLQRFPRLKLHLKYSYFELKFPRGGGSKGIPV